MNTPKRNRFPFRPFVILTLAALLVIQALLPKRAERDVIGIVRAASAEFHVQAALILAVIQTESKFDKSAVSDAGAMGLMQLLPDTFYWIRDEKLCEDDVGDAILDPTTNIRYGTYYLSYLLERFGDLRIALAAYNAGEGRVLQWLTTDPTLTDIPFPETRAYVDKVMRAYARYSKKYD